MTRVAFDLYGHQLLAPEDANKYPLPNHWYQTTKNWLDKITAGMLPAAKKQVTQTFVKKNNRDWHTKNGFIDQTHSANIDARKKAQELQKLHDTNLHNSLKAVYGEKSVYVTDNLSEWATTHASECLDIIRNNTADELDEEELPAVAKLARLYIQAQGIDAPRISKGFEYSALLKAISPKWWELKGTRAVIQMRERWFIGLGFVQAKNTPYISKEGLAWSNTKQAQQLEYLEQFELANDFGDVVEMRDMWESSSSHPEKRRTELMVRLRGMNTVAKESNWHCDFVTLTAPSKYHGCSRKWSGASPKDTQAYLCRTWALIRTAMQDAGIERFGCRVVEPHHDGTPHWHLLVFGTRKNLRVIRKIIKHYAYLEDGDEKGADKNRCDFKRMNPAKGDPVGYIAKYISKNINAKHIENEDDLELNEQGETAPLSDSVKRVQAWARVWRIRQFQFFGAPSVTVWRELRRYKEEVPKEVQPLWEAADRGEWDKFHQLFDSYQPQLLKDKTALNEYAECYPSIKGVVISGFALLTRLTEWAKRKKRGDSPATRSTVPNCRSAEKKQMTMPLEWYLWGQDKGITPRNIPAFRLMEI